LCQGEAAIGSELALELRGDLAAFVERGLAEMEGGVLSILPAGLPYSRVMAAMFDPYRQDSVRRFSSAI